MTSKADFSINQGLDFVIFFVISDSTGKTVDLEGYDAAMQLRKSIFSSLADVLSAFAAFNSQNGI